MQSKLKNLNQLLEEKKLLKVISGMENFDKGNIRMVVNSAYLSGANSIDISADSENIEWVKSEYKNLILFVSSLSTKMLVKAKEWGADVLELGNFDALYAQGKSISKEEVVQLTRELRASAGNTPICISIPGKLDINDQVDLAKQLQAAGADILQIENLNKNSEYENAELIAKSVEIPTILSGSLDQTKVEKAFSTNVNGIGIGKAINSLKTLPEMVEKTKLIVNSIGKELVKI